MRGRISLLMMLAIDEHGDILMIDENYLILQP